MHPTPPTQNTGLAMVLCPIVEERKKRNRKRKERWYLASVTPQSHPHYHLPVLLYSRMPEPRSPRRALHPPLRRHRLPEAHPLMRQRTRARQRARVRARDRHILVRHLSRRGRDVLVNLRLEAVLLHGGRGVLDADGGRLQGEGFGLGEGLVLGCELG